LQFLFFFLFLCTIVLCFFLYCILLYLRQFGVPAAALMRERMNAVPLGESAAIRAGSGGGTMLCTKSLASCSAVMRVRSLCCAASAM
jgi:hypothetical protein